MKYETNGALKFAERDVFAEGCIVDGAYSTFCMKTYFVHSHSTNLNGTKCAFRCDELESKIAPLPHHKLCLQYTATGYGKRIPTEIMVKFYGKWRRVYCCIYSNIGTCYIGKLSDNLIIRDYQS